MLMRNLQWIIFSVLHTVSITTKLKWQMSELNAFFYSSSLFWQIYFSSKFLHQEIPARSADYQISFLNV